MRSFRFLSSAVLAGAVLTAAPAAWSQEVAPMEPAAPAAEPAADAPAAAAAAEPAPEEAAPTEAAPAVEEEAPAGPSSWFRIDSDALGLQLWAGTTNDIGGVPVATDIYVGVGNGPAGGTSYGEFDIGPVIALGDLTLTPMVGLAFDWSNKNLLSLVPQFYTIYNGPVYFESWIQMFWNSLPHEAGADTLYTRDFLLFKATDDFRIGPGVELTVGLNSAAKPGGDSLVSLPVGGVINYNAMGEWKGTMGLFLGVETQDASKTGDDLVGRFTYVHYF